LFIEKKYHETKQLKFGAPEFPQLSQGLSRFFESTLSQQQSFG